MKYNPLVLGVYPYKEGKKRGIQIAMSAQNGDCGIICYDRKTGEELTRYALPEENVIGQVHYGVIEDVDFRKVSYQLYDGDSILVDERAREFVKSGEFCDKRSLADMKAIFPEEAFDWEQDNYPQIPYHEMIGYCLHVRGFTKDNSSKVKAKGTFAGIMEKIPYMKELGVTTLELQPAYEFLTWQPEECEDKPKHAVSKQNKLNYWGYTKGLYYAPKKDYCYSSDGCKELKELVKELHKNRMEMVMQFYFPDGYPATEILSILRFWKYQYHVDGFHIKGNQLPIEEIRTDEYLNTGKLWYYDFYTNAVYDYNGKKVKNTIAAYNNNYQIVMRRFLKGDEGMLHAVAEVMRNQPQGKGCINYLSNYDGFTLQDLFTYDRKHNEENGEENRDGNDCNYSWNCGIEGVTKKKSVVQLRKRQIRNAFFLLLLSQGAPLFFMGDEFGNSQGGNNNPYCQDNTITWLNWKDLTKNRELFQFVKNLIAFRKENKIFHMEKELRIMDYKACGYPDISYHGMEAWKQDWSPYNRYMGFMYCNSYAEQEGFWYVAVNMHWEEHTVALPKLPKNMKWIKEMSTFVSTSKEEIMNEKEGVMVPPRSIVIYRSTSDT